MELQARQWLTRIEDATGRLLDSAGKLADAQVREPSLLPGWTRGHVLTHIARNADGLRNLLRWADTGERTPMYASREARDADIEAGADRTATALFEDVAASATEFAAEADQLPDHAWTMQVRALAGPPFPAFGALERRLSEVEIHHVDLAAGYRLTDWPAGFVAHALPRVAGSFAGRQDTPPCRIWADDLALGFVIGPEETVVGVSVHGPAACLLAWLLGRDDGSGLSVPGGQGSLPLIPAWR